jgi:Na+-transporting NADH:ubiquinone oxidoreductase subunit D
MITYMLVIASLVIIVDQYLKAHYFELSKAMGPYVGLIITNCIIMGRAEAFASRNPVVASALDGLGNAAGYSLVLLAVSVFRELLGSGTLLGYAVMPERFDPCQLMSLAPGAFFTMGCLVWVVRAKYPAEED